MNHEDCTPGTTVFWPGAVWAAGQCVPFVRCGIVKSCRDGVCSIEEAGTGKAFSKHRHSLYLTAARANRRLAALSRQNGNRPPRPGCNKTTYPDKQAAQTVINRSLRRRRNNPGSLRAYPCNACQGWHLTKSED